MISFDIVQIPWEYSSWVQYIDWHMFDFKIGLSLGQSCNKDLFSKNIIIKIYKKLNFINYILK